jgi:hypothetical protein
MEAAPLGRLSFLHPPAWETTQLVSAHGPAATFEVETAVFGIATVGPLAYRSSQPPPPRSQP